MVENRSTIFGIIAVIIGATGLGLGAFSVISLQTVEGEQGLPGVDGIDGINGTNAPGYYCHSQAEIQQTLYFIGSGVGKIIITESITLNSTINIAGGGRYLIQGQEPGIIINSSGDWNVFDITNAKYCVIKDLKIDSSYGFYIKAIINITEINDNPVYIENIHIIGDSDPGPFSYGISIGSGNVWISDCCISNVQEGIHQSYNIEAHISDNIISNCSFYGIRLYGDYNYISGNSLDTGPEAGIRIYGSYNIIINNYVSNYGKGIFISEDENTIKNNLLIALGYGVYLSGCDNNIILGNYISNIGGMGIFLSECNFTVISDNHISDLWNSVTYGIQLYDSHSNVISGNLIFNGEYNGITLSNGDYNVITGNLITNLSRIDENNFAGIYLYNDADFNTINGNGIFNCTNSDSGTGYGIWIVDVNCDDNTVIGNTSLDNDDNWENSGTNTFGNYTNNNFF